jgi:hypothetical protein
MVASGSLTPEEAKSHPHGTLFSRLWEYRARLM